VYRVLILKKYFLIHKIADLTVWQGEGLRRLVSLNKHSDNAARRSKLNF